MIRSVEKSKKKKDFPGFQSEREINRERQQFEEVISNQMIKLKDVCEIQIKEENKIFCKICKIHKYKNFLLNFKNLKTKISNLKPDNFLFLREFFLDFDDKKSFGCCEDSWNKIRFFDIMIFLKHWQKLKELNKIKKEIENTLKKLYRLEGKKVYKNFMSSEIYSSTFFLKKKLKEEIKYKNIFNKFESFIQKIFLEEFGVVVILNN